MKDIALGGRSRGRCLPGARGIVMGTRFLASKEATIAKGCQGDVLRITDVMRIIVRTSVCDTPRGIEWSLSYNGWGIVNRSHSNAQTGMHAKENKRFYEEALQNGEDGWGESGRVTMLEAP